VVVEDSVDGQPSGEKNRRYYRDEKEQIRPRPLALKRIQPKMVMMGIAPCQFASFGSSFGGRRNIEDADRQFRLNTGWTIFRVEVSHGGLPPCSQIAFTGLL
jgi:hypothetical protein